MKKKSFTEGKRIGCQNKSTQTLITFVKRTRARTERRVARQTLKQGRTPAPCVTITSAWDID